MKSLIPVAITLLFPLTLAAQDEIPGYEIFIADLSSETKVPVNITNRPGYDNQPSFSVDGTQLYYTRMETDSQTDIWVYNLKSGQNARLTETPESEYSPTPVPDKQALSMVRVEADLKQRLWQLNLEDGDFQLLLSDLEPVGYHAWIASDSVALFLLPEPFSLVVASINGDSKTIAEHIGRSLHLNPASEALLFVDQSQTPWQIMSADLVSNEHVQLAELFPAQEDFTVSRSGTLWTGLDSKLYKRAPGADDWQLVADYADHGISGITRIAVSTDERLVALVSAE